MATDDFNRANESPLSGGGNWVTVTGQNNVNLVSNAVRAATSGQDSAARFPGSALASARFRVSTVGDSDGGAALFTSGNSQGYITTAFDVSNIMLFRMDGPGSFNSLGSAAGVYVLNAQIRIRRSGNNVVVSLAGIDIITVADTTYTTVFPGPFCFGTVEFDDFTDDGADPDTLIGQFIT